MAEKSCDTWTHAPVSNFMAGGVGLSRQYLWTVRWGNGLVL